MRFLVLPVPWRSDSGGDALVIRLRRVGIDQRHAGCIPKFLVARSLVAVTGKPNYLTEGAMLTSSPRTTSAQTHFPVEIAQ